MSAVLAVGVLLKLRAPSQTRAALGTFGLRSPRSQAVAWLAALVVEAALAVGIAAGVEGAAIAGAAVMALYAGALGVALARGRAGAPCGCFGARSRVGAGAIGRASALAVACAAIPATANVHLTATTWLTIGLAVALVAIAGLGVAVLALARELGELRLAMPRPPALDIEGEGPAVGTRTALAPRLAFGPRAELGLAVFISDGCPMCHELAPAIAHLRRDPLVALETFDEHADAVVWDELAIPGSPYAIAVALDGTVLAKGTCNSLAQLEGVLAAGERRIAGRARVAA